VLKEIRVMDMKKHFETATESFEFTTLNTYGRKKVLEFVPKNPDESYSMPFVKELHMLGKLVSVKSITKQGLMLISFDILDNPITSKIKFEDVELGNTLDV
jgi:hypothetical protein